MSYWGQKERVCNLPFGSAYGEISGRTPRLIGSHYLMGYEKEEYHNDDFRDRNIL